MYQIIYVNCRSFCSFCFPAASRFPRIFILQLQKLTSNRRHYTGTLPVANSPALSWMKPRLWPKTFEKWAEHRWRLTRSLRASAAGCGRQAAAGSHLLISIICFHDRCSLRSAWALSPLLGLLFYIKLWFFHHPHRFSNQLISILAQLTVRVWGRPPQNGSQPLLVIRFVRFVLQVWRVWWIRIHALHCCLSAALAAVSSNLKVRRGQTAGLQVTVLGNHRLLF